METVYQNAYQCNKVLLHCRQVFSFKWPREEGVILWFKGRAAFFFSRTDIINPSQYKDTSLECLFMAA